MSQKGISFRLNSQITSIAIIIIAAIVYVNYNFSNKILVGKIEEGAINQSNVVISGISRITIGTEEIARNVSLQVLYFRKNNDLNLLLKQIIASNKILESIYVELFDYRKNQISKFSSNKQGPLNGDLDSISIDKYIRKLKTENVSSDFGFWAAPFYSKFDKSHLLVSYIMPVYSPETKEIAGIVSCQISLNQLKNLLSEIKIGEKGYAFIIDKTGNFLTHPRSNWILSKNLFEKPSANFQGNIEEIESKIKSGGRGARHGISQYLDNQKAWFYYAPLSNSNWMVIIVFPEKELYREIGFGFQKIILVSGIGILILFLLNIYIFKKVLDPLIRITHAIQRFSSIPGKERKSKNEIKMLAESLEDWQAKYGILINDQTKTASDKLKFEKDLKSAQEIQLNIVPSGKPAFPEHTEIDLYAILKPAEIIGGDLYDYFFIDKTHLLIAIGDVSGKGIPASLFMAIASTLIKSNAKIMSAKDIVSKVNNELGERNSNQYFVTLFLGILDIRSGMMDYCNAAHNYPYILHADGSFQTLSKSHGLPLGIYKDKIYKSNTVELQFGDTMIFYTDGVINSSDTNNKHYGIEKLENNIRNLIDLTSEEVVTRLLKSIIIYEGENHQADDISIMALKYLHKTENQV
ncbi:MAG TPA: SpoIIE family protein phosphatase [Prolixibacteraceae bacterium]